jgi:hypothetical protein
MERLERERHASGERPARAAEGHGRGGPVQGLSLDGARATMSGRGTDAGGPV